MLELADAAFDQVALLVGERIEGVGAAAAAASTFAVGELIAPFRDDRRDAAPPQIQTDFAGGIPLVTDQDVRAGARPAAGRARQPELGQYSVERGAVDDVAAGQVQDQRQPAGFDEQMQFGGQSAAGSSERLPVLRLLRIDRPAVVPLLRAPAACW